MPLSGWWWRALAISIDGLIVSVLSGLLLLPIYLRLVRALADYLGKAFAAAEAGRAAPPQPDVATLMSSSDQLVITLVGFAVQMVYIIGFLRWRSATPGKLIVGLRVVDVDRGRSAAKLTWSSVIARALVWVVPTLYPLLFLVRLVDIAMPLWNPKRQALHDVAAKTQVVKIR
ncbi:MAG: RDD family protein [Microlunatus sp.]|nr:RDD family protein [Microlunatus sp.]MDN5769769.1 RDD family protein [Microlunatus sp.]MDN5803128.1 RDD family protein [Microlunatus sp.]